MIGNDGSALWLLAFKGPAGSGKSTLSRALSHRLGWPLIDKDDVKDILHERAPDSGGLAYEVMLNVARRQLLQGLSVICDSPLSFCTIYERAERIADETGARLAIVECVCPDEDEWRRRIESRKVLCLPSHHQTDWASFQVARQVAARHMVYPIGAPYLAVDTTQPLHELVDRVAGWLERMQASRRVE